MRVMYAVLFCSLSLLAGITAAVAAPNASWNFVAKEQGNVAFWIRDKEGSCEEQKNATPLVFRTKNLKAGAASGPLQVKELAYCFLLDPDIGTDASFNCASGSVEFTYDAAANEYRGKYDLTMKNKAVRRGEFHAQFCAPTTPVKK